VKRKTEEKEKYPCRHERWGKIVLKLSTTESLISTAIDQPEFLFRWL